MLQIKIYFDEANKKPLKFKRVLQGQSLLEFCMNHEIELQHICGGICSCTSCQVYIENGIRHLEEQSQREIDFLKRNCNARSNSRLACQAVILSRKGIIEFRIPYQEKVLVK